MTTAIDIPNCKRDILTCTRFFLRLGCRTIVLLDPTPVEIDYALSTHVFAFSFSQVLEGEGDEAKARQVSEQVLAESQGAVDLEDLGRARELCLTACSAVLDFVRATLTKRIASQVE